MKQVIQNYGSGKLSVEELPAPQLRPGGVLVRNQASLISAGTERSIVQLAQKSLVGKAKQRPDLVKKVLKTLKKRWPQSEVVIITGYPSVDTAKEAVRLGAHNYIAKPVAPDELIKAANDAVTQKRWSMHSAKPANQPC